MFQRGSGEETLESHELYKKVDLENGSLVSSGNFEDITLGVL